jgi:hypothetical protein
LAVMLFPPFVKVLRKILFLNFLDDVSHFYWVVSDCISMGFLFFHDLKHRIFMQKLKILTLSIGYFLLADMLKVFISRISLFLSC